MKASKVVNIHAVSCCKVSVHQLVFSEVLHSFGNLNAHVNHPFLGFTDLHVRPHQELKTAPRKEKSLIYMVCISKLAKDFPYKDNFSGSS